MKPILSSNYIEVIMSMNLKNLITYEIGNNTLAGGDICWDITQYVKKVWAMGGNMTYMESTSQTYREIALFFRNVFIKLNFLDSVTV